VVSTALLAACPPTVSGWDPLGWVRYDAHHTVRAIALNGVSRAQRQAAQQATLRRAASLGIAAIHECGGPGTSSEEDFTSLLSLRGTDSPEVYGYWGELCAAAKSRELGACGAGGDLYVDGALGAHTAHLREPYHDTEGCGEGYLTTAQVAAHLADCTQQRMQGGFHAIGDQAIATVVAGLALAASRLGVDRIRALRHRVEHAELVDAQLIASLVFFGVVACVQPAFDRRWGGRSGMYARRLGVRRALAANPLAALVGVGVRLAFGSDAPVTPLDPWGTIRAAMCHHDPRQRLGIRTAFAAHTRGGWRAVHRDAEGMLTPSAPATFALWQASAHVDGLPALVAAHPDEPDPSLPTCRLTVLRGQPIFDVQAPP
jgi:predicted amidohydrolase YtcJ